MNAQAQAWQDIARVEPIFAADNATRATLISRHTRGGKVPTWEEAQAMEYAAEQWPSEVITNYADRRA